ELQSRPMEFLDFTSLTLDEFQQLVPPFEAAFHARMAAWRMDGQPRTARRFTVYKTCPLLTPEDRLLFILVSLKTYTLQVVHGRLFGMVQGKAHQRIHVLWPALLAARRALGDAPARSLTALAGVCSGSGYMPCMRYTRLSQPPRYAKYRWETDSQQRFHAILLCIIRARSERQGEGHRR